MSSNCYAPTRITLSSSDTEWHAKRSQKRLSISKADAVSTHAGNELTLEAQSPRYGGSKQADELFTRKGRRKAQTEEIQLYSDEPVPRDSQAFWDQILVEAGTSAAVRQSPRVTSPQPAAPFDDFLENNIAAQPSVQGQTRENQVAVRIPTGAPELLISPRSPVSEADSEASVQKGSFTPPSPPDHGDESRQAGSRTTSSEGLDLLSVARDGVRIDHAYATDPPTSEETQDSSIHQMDLDGPSDSTPKPRHYRSSSSLRDPEPGSIGMPFSAQARKAELAASRNLSFASSVADLTIPYVPEAKLDPDHEENANCIPNSHGRTQSGGLPHSRLYIYESTAASSPERHQTTQAYLKTLQPSDGPESIVQNPRPRRTYRRRSQTYPYAESVDSTGDGQSTEACYSITNPFNSSPNHCPQEGANNSQHRTPSQNQHLDHSFTPQHGDNSLASPESVLHHPPASSPPLHSPGSRSRQSSSTNPYSPSPHTRNISSLDSIMDLPSSPVGIRDFSTLPRQPFQRSPITIFRSPENRTPSYNENNNHHQHPDTSLSRTPSITNPFSSDFLSSIHPTTPTRLSIYNDSIPAYSQPQTPVGLPRNGLPYMAAAAAGRNPFFTAPVARRRMGRGAADWFSTAFATPSRRGRRGGGGEQENPGFIRDLMGRREGGEG
ncbi:MAG: hypothetical protein Q9220_003152 [cf. Caloplaca sp. 1 TL-2023]